MMKNLGHLLVSKSKEVQKTNKKRKPQSPQKPKLYKDEGISKGHQSQWKDLPMAQTETISTTKLSSSRL